jgi:hypothetical protein
MLTTLDEGIKGGKWYSLIDKVHTERTLDAAFAQVAANQGAAGVDHVTVAVFETRREENLKDLSEERRQGTYRPQSIRRHYIPKPGSQEKRPLGIPTVRDRVVQTALRIVLEPIFERDFAPHSYGFRPRRGCKDAPRRVDERLKAGYTYIVDADLKSDFDTIPHDRLMAQVAQKVSDGGVLTLLDGFLKQSVLDDLREWTPETGSPRGRSSRPQQCCEEPCWGPRSKGDGLTRYTMRTSCSSISIFFTKARITSRRVAQSGSCNCSETRRANSSNWPITSRSSDSWVAASMRCRHSASNLARRSRAAKILGSNSDLSSNPSP